MEHDQLGEIGEVRTHPLEPLPDATDHSDNLRPGVGWVRDLPGRVEIGLPGDCNQAVAARDLAAKRSFVRHRPFIYRSMMALRLSMEHIMPIATCIGGHVAGQRRQ